MCNATSTNPESWLNIVWDALHDYRENSIPEGYDDYDEQWEELCSAMAWIREELGLPSEVELQNGEGVSVESYRVMAISTCHIQKEDTEALTNLAKRGDGMIMERDTGFFIKLYGDELEGNERTDYSEFLNQIIRYAFEHGFQMIEIDQAGPEVAGFTVFNW